MTRWRGPLADYLEPGRPTLATATSALRLVFLGLFVAQVALAFASGAIIATLAPLRSVPNEAFAIVLLAVAAAHVPLALVLAHAAARSGGRAAALSSTVLCGVLSAVPAWFAVLMLVSGQRQLYLWLVGSILAVAYALGFVMAGRAAIAALRVDIPGTPASTTEVEQSSGRP